MNTDRIHKIYIHTQINVEEKLLLLFPHIFYSENGLNYKYASYMYNVTQHSSHSVVYLLPECWHTHKKHNSVHVGFEEKVGKSQSTTSNSHVLMGNIFVEKRVYTTTTKQNLKPNMMLKKKYRRNYRTTNAIHILYFVVSSKLVTK